MCLDIHPLAAIVLLENNLRVVDTFELFGWGRVYLVVDVHTNDGLCASDILGYLVGVDEVVFFDKCLADSSLLHVFESEVAWLRKEFFLKTSSDLFVGVGLVL